MHAEDFGEPPAQAVIQLGDRRFATQRVYFAPGKCAVHRAVGLEPEPDGTYTTVALKAVSLGAAQTEMAVFGDRQLPRHATAPRVVWKNEKTNQAILESAWCETTVGQQIEQGRKFTTAETARMVAQATLALKDSGLVHRDIKPDNIFIQGNEAKLADWELAAPIGAKDRSCGTLGFMPVEVTGASHRHKPSEQTLGFARDAFALGMTATEAIAGRAFNPNDHWGLTSLFEAREHHKDTGFSDAWMRKTLMAMTTEYPEQRINDPKDVLVSMVFYDSTKDLFEAKDRVELAEHFLTWSQRGDVRGEMLAIARTMRGWSELSPELRTMLEKREQAIREQWQAVRASQRDIPAHQDAERGPDEARPGDRVATHSRASAVTVDVAFAPPRPTSGGSAKPNDPSVLCERSPPRRPPIKPPPEQSRDR